MHIMRIEIAFVVLVPSRAASLVVLAVNVACALEVVADFRAD